MFNLARRGLIEELDKALDLQPDMVNAPDHSELGEGLTLLHLTCQRGYLEMSRMLLKKHMADTEARRYFISILSFLPVSACDHPS